MKLLTRTEYDALQSVAAPGDREITDDAAWDVRLRLVEQGRAVLTTSDEWEHVHVTPAGREALRLWPMLVERGLVTP